MQAIAGDARGGEEEEEQIRRRKKLIQIKSIIAKKIALIKTACGYM